MSLLHIYNSSDSRIRQTVGARGTAHRLPIANGNALAGALDALLARHESYQRILFETHGSPGRIYFGGVYIDAAYWRRYRGHYNLLTRTNCRIYFNGCNVAEGSSGWAFLEAAAGAFVATGGGEVFGQTSVGFGNPFNGHVVHLWGDTRTLYIDNNGRILEHFEQ